MWTCPRCKRRFKSTNQSHTCVKKTVDKLFVDRPDHLVLAYDRVMNEVMHWKPNSVGASRHSVVFANHKAWLIVKPMTQELDLKFYYHEALDSEVFKKVAPFGKKYAHHIRIREEYEVTPEVLALLREGI